MSLFNLNFGAKTVPTKTVDGVLANFNKAIADLNEVQRERELLAEQRHAEAEQALHEANQHIAEAGRAQKASLKLSALLGHIEDADELPIPSPATLNLAVSNG